MDAYSVFVTGGNRGIGLGFVKHLIELPKPPKIVFATYRSTDGLEALKMISEKCKKSRVLPLKMDVTRKNEVKSARKMVEKIVGDKGLTLLINNAGVSAPQGFPQITEENLLYHFKINTVGPIMVTQEFAPLLQRAARHKGLDSTMCSSKAAVLNISSVVGSLVHCQTYLDFGLNCHGYMISKASLNMSMRVIATDLKKNDVLVVMVCPGAVKTDMNKSARAQLTVDDSVSAILKTLEGLNESHHGSFMDRNGNPYQF